jgi:hypothetical protein
MVKGEAHVRFEETFVSALLHGFIALSFKTVCRSTVPELLIVTKLDSWLACGRQWPPIPVRCTLSSLWPSDLLWIQQQSNS